MYGHRCPCLTPTPSWQPWAAGREGPVRGARAPHAGKPDACGPLWAPAVAVH